MRGWKWVVFGAGLTLALCNTGQSATPATRRTVTHPSGTTASRPATTRASSRPTTTRRASPEASRALIRSAALKLSQEYQDFRADPLEHPLRAVCDFFDKPTAEKIAPLVLVQSLGSTAGDAREVSYVNRQLLSALPGTLDEPTTRLLVVAYRSAPLPAPRPGVAQADQRKLDDRFKGWRVSDEAEATQTWQTVLDEWAKENATILAYREELYHRLPQGFETFAAAMDDLWVRMNAVVDSKTFVKTLSSDVKAWAATGSWTPEQLSALASAARKLADSKGPQYYVSAYWRESSSSFVWRKSRTGIDTGHELKDLATFLDEQARQPALKLDANDKAKKK